MAERWIQDRHYLMVPFDDKDRAKKLGARWDFKRRNGIIQVMMAAGLLNGYRLRQQRYQICQKSSSR